jgi:hypothetical protein
MTHAAPSDPVDPTRPRRIAVDAALEYLRLSREAWARGQDSAAQTFALQGILRLFIHLIEYGDV